MFKKVTLLLALLAVLLFVESQGIPVTESENNEANAAATRGPRISPSDWISFNHNWTFPSLPSVSSLFYDDDKKENGAILIRRRIDSLERTQKSIIETLRKLNQDIKTVAATCAEKKPEVNLPPKQPEQPILPGKPANDENENTTVILNSPSSAEKHDEQLPVNSEKPEVTPEPVKIEKPEAPLPIPQENEQSNLPSNEKDSTAQEIPEKIVIASTSMGENPGEHPGSISLVGFVQENRVNGRMPWNKDSKTNKKSTE